MFDGFLGEKRYICIQDTLPETNSSHLKFDGWKTILSFWDGLFSGAMLVSGSVINGPAYLSHFSEPQHFLKFLKSIGNWSPTIRIGQPKNLGKLQKDGIGKLQKFRETQLYRDGIGKLQKRGGF